MLHTSTLRARYRPNTRKTRDELFCDAVVKKIDPTGTLPIRRYYVSQMKTRWNRVRQQLRARIVGEDLLSLKAETLSPLALAAAPGNRQLAFQTYVDELLNRIVIEHDGAWMQSMVAKAYTKAVRRGMRLTGESVVPDRAGEVVPNLATLSTMEMQGIAEAVSQRVVRAATLATVNRMSPRDAFKEMDLAIDKVGIARSIALVETMVVKAFSEGTLDQFEQAGIKKVGLIPELVRKTRRRVKDAKEGPGSRISRKESPSRRTVGRIREVARKLETEQLVEVVTAGDDLVCPECEEIEENNPYSIDEARSLIPAHVNCRCAFVPLEE